MIDVKSQEIKPADNETYSDMQQLADELPDSSPRFILLSYPLTLVSIQSSQLISFLFVVHLSFESECGEQAIPLPAFLCKIRMLART